MKAQYHPLVPALTICALLYTGNLAQAEDTSPTGAPIQAATTPSTLLTEATRAEAAAQGATDPDAAAIAARSAAAAADKMAELVKTSRTQENYATAAQIYALAAHTAQIAEAKTKANGAPASSPIASTSSKTTERPTDLQQVQNAADKGGLDIKAGAQLSLRTPRRVTESHQITYRGNPVGKQGAALTTLDVTKQFSVFAPTTDTDTPDLLLDFKEGQGYLNNGSFGALKSLFQEKQFKLNDGLAITVLRGAVDLKGKTGRLDLGEELPPLRLSHLHIGNGYSLADWFRFGVAASRQWHEQSNGNNLTTAVLTERGFIGKSFGWHADQGKVDFSLADLLKAAPTYEDYKAFAEPNKKVDGEAEKLLKFIATDHNKENPLLLPHDGSLSQADYVAGLTKHYLAHVRGLQLVPNFTLGLATDAWMNLTGNSSERRPRGGLEIVAKHRFDISHRLSNAFLSIQFDRGREYANPNDVRNHLTFSFNGEFSG